MYILLFLKGWNSLLIHQFLHFFSISQGVKKVGIPKLMDLVSLFFLHQEKIIFKIEKWPETAQSFNSNMHIAMV